MVSGRRGKRMERGGLERDKQLKKTLVQAQMSTGELPLEATSSCCVSFTSCQCV